MRTKLSHTPMGFAAVRITSERSLKVSDMLDAWSAAVGSLDQIIERLNHCQWVLQVSSHSRQYRRLIALESQLGLIQSPHPPRLRSSLHSHFVNFAGI